MSITVTAQLVSLSRREALEEAAQLVEHHPEDPSHGYGGSMRVAQLQVCKHLAAAIRALIDPETDD